MQSIEPGLAASHAARYDRAGPTATGQILHLRPDGANTHPVRARIVGIPELDLMARCAGLRLRERCADWRRRPMDAGAQWQFSVYEAVTPWDA